KMLWYGALAVVALAFVFIVPFASERRWYLGFVPPQIRTAGVVRISGTTGLFSGCGVAIFRLASETRDAIRRQGIAFLDSARTAERTAYEPWAETPVRSELLAGISCAKLRTSVSNAVYSGLSKP